MKKILVGLTALTMLAGPLSAARDYPYHVVYTYLDDNGNFVGRFTIYCDGREELIGTSSNNSYAVFGQCNAP